MCCNFTAVGVEKHPRVGGHVGEVEGFVNTLKPPPRATAVGLSLTTHRVSSPWRNMRSHTALQAAYRGERTRNRVVQPALDAFRDVLDRISAECPGLTAEDLCGPVHLPRWLSTDHCTTASAATGSGAGSVGDGSAGCTRAASTCDHAATAATAAAAAAAAASTTLPCATALRDEEAVTGSDGSDKLKQPPPRPATPRLSSVLVESEGLLAPPGAVVSVEGRDPTNAVGQAEKSGEEKKQEEGEEAEQEQNEEEEEEVANPTTARTENMGGVSGSLEGARPGGSAQRLVEDAAVERHAIGVSEEASLPAGTEENMEALQDRRQRSTESRDGEEETRLNLFVPFASEGEGVRQGSCGDLPVESNVVDTGGTTSLDNRSTTDADVDCFTYSDGEDGGFAATPGRKNTSDDSVLLSPRPTDSSASPSAAPSRPTTSSVADAVAASPPGERAEGTGGCNERRPDDSSESVSHESKRLSHAIVGEETDSKRSSWKESVDNETGRAVDDKRGNSEPPEVVGGERRGTIVDSRGEGGTIRKSARAGSRQDTATPAAALEASEGAIAREGEEGSLALARRGRNNSSADVLARAYATVSSPTPDTPSLLGRGRIRDENLGRSLTGSVYSSFDASPLKGESISTSALAAARISSDAGYSDGVENGGVDLLTAAKAVVSGERHCTYDAAVGEDPSQPFSTWLDDDRRPAHPKAGVGFSAGDIDRRASGSGGAYDSRRPEPTLEFAGQAGCDGERAASIADWSSEELEEELCRVREAIESRVRVSVRERR